MEIWETDEEGEFEIDTFLLLPLPDALTDLMDIYLYDGCLDDMMDYN